MQRDLVETQHVLGVAMSTRVGLLALRHCCTYGRVEASPNGNRPTPNPAQPPLTCTSAESSKNPPSSPTRFRSCAVFVWMRWPCLEAGSHARPPRRPRPNRPRRPDAGSGVIHGDRQAGPKATRPTGNGSAGSPIPSTSREARSEETEVTRLRMSRSQRRPNAWGRRIASGRRRDRRRLVGAAPTRRLPWQAVATSEGDERGHEHMILRRWPLPPLGRRAEREGCGLRVTRRVWRGAVGLPAHFSSTARPADRIVASRAGEDGESGHLAPPSLPLQSTRVRLQSPDQDPWRGIRESLPREADRDCLEDRTDA
jgi:hypothetical protein